MQCYEEAKAKNRMMYDSGRPQKIGECSFSDFSFVQICSFQFYCKAQWTRCFPMLRNDHMIENF